VVAETALRSAVIVLVAEAAAAVDAWRERTCTDRPSIGIPAHITLVFPFVPAASIDDELIASLRRLIGQTRSFVFALRETRRFPTVTYLAPDTPQPFIGLTEAITSLFPEHLPYEGCSAQAFRTSQWPKEMVR
jgi:2'-5' RNA ligase